MALPTPRLDDRRFQDLVDDTKRLVQRHCPEWTDHNVSDPGVTLIETFAYMTDQLLYRLNRVPDRLHVKFLELIGLRLLPPAAARAQLTFRLSAAADAPFTVPAGSVAGTAAGERDEPVVFTTIDDLLIVPCALQSVATEAVPRPRPDGALDADGDADPATVAGEPDPDGPVDRTDAFEFGSPVAAFGDVPLPGDCLLVGLDTPTPRCAVRIDFTGESEGVGVNPAQPPLAWQAVTDAGWVDCDVEDDGTGGLNRSGSVVVHVPDGHTRTVIAGRAAAWLRAIVVDTGDGRPPYSRSPVVRGLAACTVGGTAPAVNAEVVEAELLGESEGVAGQRFELARTPVAAGLGHPVIEVSDGDGWQEWTVVEHFAASGPDDRHVVLDAVAGEVVLGPAVRQPDGTMRRFGATPPHGAALRVRRYAVGGGAHGNVASGTVTALRSSIPFVTAVDNRTPAQGGVDGETLDEARERGPLLLRTRDRAVTAEDYEALARDAAPEVARVRCVPASGPDGAANTVRLLVVPAAASERGRVRLEDLIPDDATFARIAERLDATRVVGTTVLLEPPRYRGVTVVARLLAKPRTDAARVEQDALEAMYRLLNPLPGGGPDGTGWPFGRPVQVGDLFAALHRVRGVELVEDLRLFGANPVTGRRGAEVKRLELEPTSLVFSFEHHVKVEES